VDYYIRACDEWFLPIVITGIASFAASSAVTFRGRGATVGPALVLSVLAPLVVGLLSCVQGAIVSFRFIEQVGAAPEARSLFAGCGTALASVELGLMFAVPAAMIGLIGATVRALMAPKNATLP